LSLGTVTARANGERSVAKSRHQTKEAKEVKEPGSPSDKDLYFRLAWADCVDKVAEHEIAFPETPR